MAAWILSDYTIPRSYRMMKGQLSCHLSRPRATTNDKWMGRLRCQHLRSRQCCWQAHLCQGLPSPETVSLQQPLIDSVRLQFHWKPHLGTHALTWDECMKVSSLYLTCSECY